MRGKLGFLNFLNLIILNGIERCRNNEKQQDVHKLKDIWFVGDKLEKEKKMDRLIKKHMPTFKPNWREIIDSIKRQNPTTNNSDLKIASSTPSQPNPSKHPSKSKSVSKSK